MNFRLQALLFVIIMFAAIIFSPLLFPRSVVMPPQSEKAASASPPAAHEADSKLRSFPRRRWDILDPAVDAVAATAQLIESPFSFLNYRITEPWPIASLTKLLTALVVLEQFGSDKKVPVSLSAVLTEGEAGELSSGEIYPARDLLKIMLMTSSNDAAVAFEEYAGGRESLVALMRQKLIELDMRQTFIEDASGLSDYNRSTAADLVKLAAYIARTNPDIFAWSRFQSILVQPLNGGTTRTITNINPLAASAAFLGGKTGTSLAARENLVAMMSHGTNRIIVVILGSNNRFDEITSLMAWVDQAYE